MGGAGGVGQGGWDGQGRRWGRAGGLGRVGGLVMGGRVMVCPEQLNDKGFHCREGELNLGGQ
jgi:hypothetical protein